MTSTTEVLSTVVRKSSIFGDVAVQVTSVKKKISLILVKVKLSLCLTKHCAMKTYVGVDV
jgi:hypothetical protein